MSRKLINKKNNRGVSLAEMLIVVAILLILMAVAVPSVITIQKNLRQTELDAKAETIYVAVQNRLASLYASGRATVYDPATYAEVDQSIKLLGKYPGDYDQEDDEGQDEEQNESPEVNQDNHAKFGKLNEDSVYYILSGGGQAVDAIITPDVLDGELYNGHWVVELIPYAYRESPGESKTLTLATVYAVYYSEKEIDVAAEYSSGYSLKNNDYSYLKNLRDKTVRLKDGARVGYYGGSNVGSTSTTSELTVTNVEIHSEKEVLTANVKCKKPASITEPMEVKFVLSDTKGNKYSITYYEKDNAFKTEEGYLYTTGNISVKSVGQSYSFVMTLDDLSDSNKRFDKLYGKGSGHNDGGLYTNRELVCGTEIKLEVTASCPTDHTIDSSRKSDIGNSLFAKDSVADTAVLTCGRHLQNLDKSSNVTKEIIKAQQKNNITFGEQSDWYASYKTSYFNKNTNRKTFAAAIKVPNFKPIENENLIVYNGKFEENKYSISDLTVSTTGDNPAGLFGSVGKTQISLNDIMMTGTFVSATSDAGAIVGKVISNKDVTMSGCQIYLSRDKGDVPTSISATEKLEAVRWVVGKNAGGLVGNNQGNLKIVTSAASTVIGNEIAGGLIGSNSGNLEIKRSYADSYLYGSNTGGLVGKSTSTALSIESCYAAGFIGLKDTNSVGAGLVNGDVRSAKKSYTLVACYLEAENKGIDKDSGKITLPSKGTYYSTVVSGTTFDKVFYFNVGSSDENNIKDTECINTMTTAQLQEKLGTDAGFNINTIGTQPYKLMGQSLTTYTYPRINELAHYGDWETVFQSGALVYYEEYQNKTNRYFGFDGAGVDISLSAEDTIVGDGYGIILRDGDSMPSEITVKSGDEQMTFDPSVKPYKTVYYREGASTVTYRIYPLDKDWVNPTKAVSEYFRRVVISQTAGESTTNMYYDFNPHFARTVQEVIAEDSPVSNIESIISIRSPRHLNNLSMYYESETKTKAVIEGYRDITGSRIYGQERNLVFSSYDWGNYSIHSQVVKEQEPIARTKSGSFKDRYYGGCYYISDISFVSNEADYVGMFGYVSGDAELKDIVLATNYQKNSGTTNYRVQRTKAVGANEEAYFGVLAGYNEGIIDNCAVAGYYLSGSDGTIHGYPNSNIYIGGIVGWNAGKISNSAVSCPRMRLSMFGTTCYAGGFVGWNESEITNCYDLNHIDAVANDGKTVIAGFVAQNSGSISQCYCATALTSSGLGTHSYGFVPEGGGSVTGSYYLQAGSYQFVDGLYAYETVSEDGSKRTYQQLVNMNNNKAENSYFHDNTTRLDQNETAYPYRAVVKDRNGNPVHYGEWQTKPELGTIGLFYWEHEIDGQNNGYKITYIGTSEGSSQYQTTLCTAHDDGGVIESFGYGYYFLNGEENHITYELEGIIKANSVSGTGTAKSDMESQNYNQAAAKALQNQIPGYTFLPYTTKITDAGNDFIYLSGYRTNGIWKLKYNGGTVAHDHQFNLSPFFANAMQYYSATSGEGNFVVTDSANNQTYYARTPGSELNPYEIRNVQQLQFINWNYATKKTDTLVEESTKAQFNYLMYTSFSSSESGKQTLQTAENNTVNHWKQTHDVEETNRDHSFAPIAGQKQSSSVNEYDASLYAWFGGNYDGENYKISEISINSKSATVGLFGVTAGGSIKNIILYSKNNAVIMRSTQKDDIGTSYAIGGMVGVAYRYDAQTGDIISNCAIAGYQIIDDSHNAQGLGEANVGGLIGVANVSLEKCSAVVDIKIQCTHPKSDGSSGITCARYGNYVRVGGVAGATQFKLTDCYSGGKIEVSESVLDENYTSGNSYVASTSTSTVHNEHSTNIYIGGIAGSGFAMNYKNFSGQTGHKEGYPIFENCYTYMKFPAYRGTIRAIALIGSLADRHTAPASDKRVTITNCYYLDNCADIDTSKAPKFKLNSSSDTVFNLINQGKAGNGKTYLEDMLSGDSRYVGKMIVNSEKERLKSGSTMYKESYQSLSADIYQALNNGRQVWGKVTTEDAAGGNITGKYSFPGTAEHLAGKDYPFPTVITQKDVTFGTTVFVHYGEWPLPGARWTKGKDTFNLFDYITETNDWAIKEYIFDPNGEEGMGNLSVDDFTVTLPDSEEENSEIAMIDSVEKNPDQTFTVKIKAVKNGTVKISEKSSGSFFVLEITAGLRVNVEPKSMVLQKNDENSLVLTAVSSTGGGIDYSTCDALEWNVTVSKTSEGDDAAEVAPWEGESKNYYKVKGYGYDATLTVTADYNYHDNHFTGISLVNVRRMGVVGVSDGSKYFECEVKDVDSGIKNGSMKSYSQESTDRPIDSSRASFFLYDTEAAGLLNHAVDQQGVTISLSAGSVSKPDQTISASLSAGLSTDQQSDFRILTGKLTYEPALNVSETAEVLEDVKLDVSIRKDNGATYHLEMDGLKATPLKQIKVSFFQNDVDGVDDVAPVVDETTWRNGKEHVVPECCFDSISGYVFSGWNTKKDGTGKQYMPGETIVLEEDTDLFAQWTNKVMKLVDGNQLIVQIQKVEDLNNFSQMPVREGWELLGWYTKKDIAIGKKVLNADGTVFQDVAGYTANGQIDINEIKEVYACWRKESTVWVPATTLQNGVRYLISNAKSGSDVSIVYQSREVPGDIAKLDPVYVKTGLQFTSSVETRDITGIPYTIPIALCENLNDKYIWKASEEDGVTALRNMNWPNTFLAENDTQVGSYGWAVGCVTSNDKLVGGKKGRKGFQYTNGYLVNVQGSTVKFDMSIGSTHYIYGNSGTPENQRTYLLEEKMTYDFSFADHVSTTLYNDGNAFCEYKVYLDDHTLPKSYCNPVKEGMRFTGWYTSENGGEMVIDSTGKIVFPINSDMILFAQWEEEVTITLSYGAYTNETVKLQVSGETNDLSQLMGYITPVKATRSSVVRNWTFDGWYTDNSGNGGTKVFDENGRLIDGQFITVGKTYYAGWKLNAWAPITSLDVVGDNPVFLGRYREASSYYRMLSNSGSTLGAEWFKNDAVFQEKVCNAEGKTVSSYMITNNQSSNYRWYVEKNEDIYILRSSSNEYLQESGNNSLKIGNKNNAAGLSLVFTETEHLVTANNKFFTIDVSNLNTTNTKFGVSDGKNYATETYLLMEQDIMTFAYEDLNDLSLLALLSEEISDTSELSALHVSEEPDGLTDEIETDTEQTDPSEQGQQEPVVPKEDAILPEKSDHLEENGVVSDEESDEKEKSESEEPLIPEGFPSSGAESELAKDEEQEQADEASEE